MQTHTSTAFRHLRGIYSFQKWILQYLKRQAQYTVCVHQFKNKSSLSLAGNNIVTCTVAMNSTAFLCTLTKHTTVLGVAQSHDNNQKPSHHKENNA